MHNHRLRNSDSLSRHNCVTFRALSLFAKNPGLADSPGAILYRASGARYAITSANFLVPQLEPRRGGEIIAGGKRSAAPG